MKKLIIQIPCYNEEKTLPLVLKDLPKKIKGIKKIAIQVIDDGSTDKTYQTAKKLKVDYLIRFKQNRGLATAFKAGISNALAQQADILVTTDGDNQYCGQDISKLVKPIISKKADIVVGCRPIENHPDFSWLKKKLQKIGSFLVRKLSRTEVSDVSSGFRAYNREAMLHINIFSSFSYCLETLIQLGLSNLKIDSVNIRVNPKTRESRLYTTIFQYLWHSGRTIIKIFLLYRSYQVFTWFTLITFISSIFLVLRYLVKVYWLNSPARTFWPTIVLAGVLLAISFQLYLTGFLTSLLSSNRKLSEEIVYRLRKLDVNQKKSKKN